MVEQIPEHLLPYIAKQDASLYTPLDHASWRFILRVSRAYFAEHAHQKYLDGLRETGISIERIPLVEEMDQCLRRFGWRAVPVSGFIPPAVFMEFQSLGILPIACEMRTLEHLAYTPAPDIVHEAAGHAPIIADPEYAAYLRNYGEVSRKAIFSDQDMRVYEAVRNLSVVKEDPRSTDADIADAQQKLDEATAAVSYVSEASLLARMNWWTVEYGLVGSLKEPKIYGAGLLSSVGESYHCLGPEVKKIPFTLKCIETPYDITKPQPQLFVTPTFEKLTEVLEEFAQTMAFRKGGAEALEKGRAAKSTVTVELDSGVQISGTLNEYRVTREGAPSFFRFQGPTQLSYGEKELPGHDPSAHREGFSAPLGRVHLSQGGVKSPSELTEDDLAKLGFKGSEPGRLRFESDILLQGRLKSKVERDGKTLVLTFTDCTVRMGDVTLFDPSWGVFDLACGVEVRSVFGGAADRGAYIRAMGGHKQQPGQPKSNLTEANRALNELSAKVRGLREAGAADENAREPAELAAVCAKLDEQYPEDWLIRLELLELDASWQLGASWAGAVRARLAEIARRGPAVGEMIARGLALVGDTGALPG